MLGKDLVFELVLPCGCENVRVLHVCRLTRGYLSAATMSGGEEAYEWEAYAPHPLDQSRLRHFHIRRQEPVRRRVGSEDSS